MTTNPVLDILLSWTEHISRKLHWNPDPAERREAMRRCGFDPGSEKA